MKQLLFVLIVFSAVSGSAQQSFQDSVAIKRARLHKTNMYLLAGWAGGNMLSGTISASNTHGSDHYFYQMNAYWNITNFVIAGFGLHAVKKQLAGEHTFERNMLEQHKLEKIFVFNGGLDLAYIMTGFYLKEHGSRLNDDRSEGYGRSLVLQGGFLLVFDIIQYAGHRRIGKLLDKRGIELQALNIEY